MGYDKKLLPAGVDNFYERPVGFQGGCEPFCASGAICQDAEYEHAAVFF